MKIAPAAFFISCITWYKIDSSIASSWYAAAGGRISPWQTTMQATAMLPAIDSISRSATRSLCYLIRLMVNAGADLNIQVTGQSNAHEVIDQFIQRAESEGRMDSALTELKASLEQPVPRAVPSNTRGSKRNASSRISPSPRNSRRYDASKQSSSRPSTHTKVSSKRNSIVLTARTNKKSPARFSVFGRIFT